MNDPVKEKTPFDERAALEKLEHLLHQIKRYKAERQAVEDQFDQFVRSFKTSGQAEDTKPATAEWSKPAARSVLPLSPSTPSPSPSISPAASADTVPQDREAVPPEPMLAPPVRRQAKWSRRGLLVGALILVIGAGLVTWTLRKNARDSLTPASHAPAIPVTAPTTVSAPPAPTPITPSAFDSEITTSRRVWMRVLVDGARVLEREVPADTHVPLKAEKTIVIRTGDAGAVRLSVAGQDQGFLGAEGEVVTRTFTVPSTATR